MSFPILAAIRANSDRCPFLSSLVFSSGRLASLEAEARSDADSTQALNSFVRSFSDCDMVQV